MNIFSQGQFWVGVLALLVAWKLIEFSLSKLKGKYTARHKVVAMLWHWHARILRLALAIDNGVCVYDQVSAKKIHIIAEESSKHAVELAIK